MTTLSKVCRECGTPVLVGHAVCTHCGARVGTVFSDAGQPALIPKTASRQKVQEHIAASNDIEAAHERGNHSVILSLISFFPILGILLGPASIYMGLKALKTLRRYNVEEGRGMATTGIIIGGLAVIAQASYTVMFLFSSQRSITQMFGM